MSHQKAALRDTLDQQSRVVLKMKNGEAHALHHCMQCCQTVVNTVAALSQDYIGMNARPEALHNDIAGFRTNTICLPMRLQ